MKGSKYKTIKIPSIEGILSFESHLIIEVEADQFWTLQMLWICMVLEKKLSKTIQFLRICRVLKLAVILSFAEFRIFYEDISDEANQNNVVFHEFTADISPVESSLADEVQWPFNNASSIVADVDAAACLSNGVLSGQLDEKSARCSFTHVFLMPAVLWIFSLTIDESESKSRLRARVATWSEMKFASRIG